jgi:hypothetical protein
LEIRAEAEKEAVMNTPHNEPTRRWGNERTVVVPDYPKTDVGRAQAFSDGAKGFLESDRLLNVSPFYREQYVLTFHALELALKSFLAGRGLSDVELRNKYRHDLDKLYDEACNHGLKLNTPDAARLIKDANQHHEKSLLRYLFNASFSLPTPEIAFPVIVEILASSK